MDAKAYLRSVRAANTAITRITREREQLADLRYRITQDLRPVAGSGGGMQEGFTAASDKIIDLEAELEAAACRYVALTREAGERLRKIENVRFYEVLHRHYILFDTWEQIAVDMGYTYRNVCYLHKRGLNAFQKVLDEIEE